MKKRESFRGYLSAGERSKIGGERIRVHQWQSEVTHPWGGLSASFLKKKKAFLHQKGKGRSPLVRGQHPQHNRTLYLEAEERALAALDLTISVFRKHSRKGKDPSVLSVFRGKVQFCLAGKKEKAQYFLIILLECGRLCKIMGTSRY